MEKGIQFLQEKNNTHMNTKHFPVNWNMNSERVMEKFTNPVLDSFR